MAVYDTLNIRNIAVIGHGTTGKTTLVSSLLYTGGMTDRLGLVDNGHAPTDYTEEEIRHKRSFYTTPAYVEWKKTKINILDTPGYGAFIFEVRGALRVVDAALVLVDATAGVEVITAKVWQYAEEENLPCAIVMTKMDRERADFERALDSCRHHFGRSVIPVQVPLGQESSFSGAIDLIRMKSYQFEPGSEGMAKIVDIPEDIRAIVDDYHEKLVEMIAETDESLMEKYFESGELTEEDRIGGLKRAFVKRQIIPAFCLSPLKNIGAGLLLDGIVEWFPNPADRGPIQAEGTDGSTLTVEVDSNQPFAGFIFKTISDPYTGRVSLMRVYSGTLQPDRAVWNTTQDGQEKTGALQTVLGKQYKTVPEVRAGDIVALTKLKETSTGDTLCDPIRKVRFHPVVYGKPVIFFALEPKSRADEDKLSSALSRLVEEDPMLHLERDPQTKELILSGAGELHIRVAVERMKSKFGVDVELRQPKIPYRETIKSTTEAQGKYKKQSGGRGQYGDCWIRVEPLPSGEDFIFEETIFGGVIPKQYIPAVEKGILEAREHGVLAGFPVVDFKVTLFDGSYHEVDSSELAFKIAGSMAFKKAMEKANPVLLEPVMKVMIFVPEESLGDVMGDLNSRRARIMGMDRSGQMQLIRAMIPLAEMLNFNPALTSITGARGYFEMEFDHYEEVPPHIAQKIIDNVRKEREESQESH